MLFFFFKQKTAYEMATRLEFRRVLFRSGDAPGRRLNSGSQRPAWRIAQTGGRSTVSPRAARTSKEVAEVMRIIVSRRSEERRVGKECRSRWWASQYRNMKRKPVAAD